MFDVTSLMFDVTSGNPSNAPSAVPQGTAARILLDTLLGKEYLVSHVR